MLSLYYKFRFKQINVANYSKYIKKMWLFSRFYGQIGKEAAIHWQVQNFYDNLDKDDKDVALKSWKFTYFGIDYQNIAANYWILKNIHFPIF